MNSLNPEIEEALKKRNIRLLQDKNKIITDFLNSNEKTAEKVYKFITIHPSYRALFNAIIKAGWIDVDNIKTKVSELNKEANTSICMEAHCNCDTISDYPIIRARTKSSDFNKKLTCKNCGDIKFDISKYSPVFEVHEDIILQTLAYGRKMGFLEDMLTSHCFKCKKTTQIIAPKTSRKIKCSKCKEYLSVTPAFYPLDINLDEISKDKQGYWLEWFVYELLKRKFPTDFGLVFDENATKTNIDVICLHNDKIWAIECKDTDDVRNFTRNMDQLNKVADKVCLVTTKKVDEKTLKMIENHLKEKFIYVKPSEIEKIADFIQNLS